jgi:hypothetical protein
MHLDGKATALILHRNGRDTHAKRISDDEARQIEDAVARRKEQKTGP